MGDRVGILLSQRPETLISHIAAYKLGAIAVQNPRERYGVQLRSVTAGGETLGMELCEWTREALGVELNEHYGQTECDFVIGCCAALMKILPGAIGKTVPGHTVELIDDGGNVVKTGEVGEVAVKSPDPAIFFEYWNNPEATGSARPQRRPDGERRTLRHRSTRLKKIGPGGFVWQGKQRSWSSGASS